MPSSMTSAPAFGNCSSSASAVSKSGSPAVMNGTNAARFCFLSAANAWEMRDIFTSPLWGGRRAQRSEHVGWGSMPGDGADPHPKNASHFSTSPQGGGEGTARSYLLPQRGGRGEYVLVAAAREADRDDLVLRHLRRDPHHMRDG